jgi:VIT1/CCC1 family predicted Fe2+/Mn2+ transporter
MAINLVLTLLIFTYFLLFTNFGIIAAFSFLLLNGVGFALTNFLLIIPFLFYQQEGGSFLVYLLCFVFIILLILSGYFLASFI